MESICTIFRIGMGPSSSHTMGPRLLAGRFRERSGGAASYRVTLYGSLAATGRGHLTDRAIADALAPADVVIVWKPDEYLPAHPNGMLFESLSASGDVLQSMRAYSIGGGDVMEEGASPVRDDRYPMGTMKAMVDWCEETGKPLWELAQIHEEEGLWDYLGSVWTAMKDSIARGLQTEGILPGVIKLERKARSFYLKARRNNPLFQRTGFLASYALAVAEENASGGTIATAPTCGSAGVLPSVCKYLQDYLGIDDREIFHALAVAGLFGAVVKAKASISGALVGCQGEVGTACAMAAASAAYLVGGTIRQMEYAAEMGMEHHLGLTCDPVAGLVQIPCIERNAIAAMRSLDCADYALLSDGRHRVSFDEVVETMKQTGLDMKRQYKETSEGGLARFSRL